jgi:dTDP-glucose pyrophosphorylase
MNTPRLIQLVVPMAGLGSRFTDAGYTVPKPLLDIRGVPMFQLVLANLASPSLCKIVLIVPKVWGLASRMTELGAALGVDVVAVEVEGLTDGPAGSVALAESHLDPELPVVTANSDQYLDADLGDFYKSVSDPANTGVILAMEDTDPKWSYARLDENGKLAEVREKVVISNLATVGVYGFKSSEIMFEAFRKMRADGASVNGEYYVAPAYNYLLGPEYGGVVVTNLGSVGSVMHGLGIPVDYERFIKLELSKRAADHTLRALNSQAEDSR